MTTSILIALAFAVLATAAWRRRPVAARIHLAAATAFALAALAGDAPGGAPHDGLGYVVAAAGLSALAALGGEAARLARRASAAR